MQTPKTDLPELLFSQSLDGFRGAEFGGLNAMRAMVARGALGRVGKSRNVP